MREIFVQIGLIVFPICIYQIWLFGKSYGQLPWKGAVMGIYGGIAAILCQQMPVHLLGQPENFQCVPVILSMLYGKRRAGLTSIGILGAYQILVLPHHWTVLWNVAGILVYSAIPFIVCNRFARLHPRMRFVMAQVLSLATLLVELLFLAGYFMARFGMDGFNRFADYLPFLGAACLIQFGIMALAFFLLENILDNGQVRTRLESLIRYNPAGICVFDSRNRFVAVNAAYEAITGYRASELLGRSRLGLWRAEEHRRAEEILDYALHGEIKQGMEVSLRHKDGHAVPVRFTPIPIREGGELYGFFAMIMDISEEKAAEELVRNSEKLSAVGQLAAGVAHEIRNPLTAIKGFLQLLSKADGAVRDRYMEIMQVELSRIEGIVSEMLVLAKPQAVSFQPVLVRDKLEEVANLLTGEANLQNIEVIGRYCEEPLQVRADGNQLKQVFLNLGKNAIEAMSGGGTLTLDLRQEADRAVVTFTDNGPGIPEELLKKIGEPFFTTKSGGTGLGFLISRRIIEHHEGSMNIVSKPGAGTRIEVNLPLRMNRTAEPGGKSGYERLPHEFANAATVSG